MESEDPEAGLQVKRELLEREPFAQLTLDGENGNAVLEISPLDRIPSDPKPTDRLRIRLLAEPDQEYEVIWQHIVRIRTYDQLVFEEAQRLVKEKKFDEAFRYFDYLVHQSPVTPRLKRAILEYMLDNAAAVVEQRNYQHALAILEELARRDPDFQAAEVGTRIAQVADTLIAEEVQREEFGKARGLIARLEKEYAARNIESLGRWRTRLIQEATLLRQQALEKMQQDEYRAAEGLSRRMVRIWPDLPGAAQLRRDIARLYPMAIIGVAEVAGKQDVTSIDSWPGRRTGQLTQRTLLQFIGAGPEGGQYLCPLGEYYQSDDRRRLTLQLAPTAETQVGAPVERLRRLAAGAGDGRSPIAPLRTLLGFADARDHCRGRVQSAHRPVAAPCAARGDAPDTARQTGW